MQYIRERLSLNLALDQPTVGSNAPDGQEAEPDVPDTPPKPPARKTRDGAKLSEVAVSPTASTFSTASNHHHRTQSVDTTPSTYGTPFQSPVASEKWYPHSHSVLPHQTSVRYDKRTSSGVFVVDHGQFSGFPQGYSTPVNGGYVNHTFTNDSGNNENDPVHYNQQRVIREQYWSWSCKCRRQFSNREKILLLVIFFLLLVIGGLAAYLGIISEDGNPLQGGLLTPGVLHQKTVEVQHL